MGGWNGLSASSAGLTPKLAIVTNHTLQVVAFWSVCDHVAEFQLIIVGNCLKDVSEKAVQSKESIEKTA